VLRSSDSVLVSSLDDLPVEEGGSDGRKSSDSSLEEGEKGKEKKEEESDFSSRYLASQTT